MVKKRPGIAGAITSADTEELNAPTEQHPMLEKEAPKADAPKSLDDLEAEHGEAAHGGRMEFNSIDDLNPEDFESAPENDVPELDLAEIAEISHNTLVNYHNLMFPKKEPMRYYLDLGDDEKSKLINDTHEVMQTAANPNDEEVARLKHAHFAMNLLATGYKFAVEEDDSQKETPLVMPWEYLPNAHRLRFMMFRDVARRLVKSVWSGR